MTPSAGGSDPGSVGPTPTPTPPTGLDARGAVGPVVGSGNKVKQYHYHLGPDPARTAAPAPTPAAPAVPAGSRRQWWRRGWPASVQSRWTRRRAGVVALVALLVITWSVVSWGSAGLRDGCFTAAGPGFGSGLTAVTRASSGECYGFTDSLQVGWQDGFTFGPDPATKQAQREVLHANNPLGDGDLTVVWLGALSCEVVPQTQRCADGRDYQAEREDLQGLRLAQLHGEQRNGVRVHVVLANAGQNVRFADAVAQLIVDHRGAFGSRVVVIGGGDSRKVTQRAINILLDAGIAFISHTLNADPDAPGRPLVDRPGYLQLSQPSALYAGNAAAWLASRLPPTGGGLVVYQEPDPSDLYTTSLVSDLLEAVTHVQPVIAPRHVQTLAALNDSICRRPAVPGSQTAFPTAVFFASRWNRFSDFAHRVTELCGAAGPYLVMSDTSVSRFMNNDPVRASTGVTWPLAYYTSGYQCTELRTQRDAPAGSGAGAAVLLSLATLALGVNCDTDGQLGAQVAPVWDVVGLATELLRAGAPSHLDELSGTYQLSGIAGPAGQLTVLAGRLARGGIPITRLCVEQVLRGQRSNALCEKAFPARTG